MPAYTPPIDDMIYTLRALAGYEDAPGARVADIGMAEAILTEAGKLAADVLAPLNHDGDWHGSKLTDGAVKTAAGFKDAYAVYCAGGWNSVPFPSAYGGQGLPWAVAFPVQEMWQAANMSFGLCPLLNQGAVEAILNHGSDEQKQTYLPKLISGEWTGTMNLTESQAGSDLGAIRTRAEPAADGTYKITGQKIFITYGEHDMAENIIHLVLARVSGAPEGAKGISLFIVPKILADGTCNDVVCGGTEKKMGIHASPTCTMVYGEGGGATGYLVGAVNEGLKYMFTMMNNARLSVGLQGVAVASRACQAAAEYAASRVQGKSFAGGADVTIGQHPDVRRMLMTMQSCTFACRALTYEAAVHLDRAHAGDASAQEMVELLTPIVKAFSTDMAQEVTSLGVQVYGGMGFIEETGMSQFYRDARILPIYEGTNGIQAADLVFRKLVKNGGRVLGAWTTRARQQAGMISPYLDLVDDAAARIMALAAANPAHAAAHASPFLRLCGVVMCGAMMARVLADAGAGTDRQNLARFYIEQVLPAAHTCAAQIKAAPETVIVNG